MLTSRFKTIAIVGYSSCVNCNNRNGAAHGAVCLLQARRGENGIIGRKVNSNGRHKEISEPFDLDKEILIHWERIARDSK